MVKNEKFQYPAERGEPEDFKNHPNFVPSAIFEGVMASQTWEHFFWDTLYNNFKSSYFPRVWCLSFEDSTLSLSFSICIRYCGSILSPTGGSIANAASQPIITCDRPFRMFFQTGAITPGAAPDAAANAAAQSTGVHTTGVAPVNVGGFQFTYRQLPGNC